MKKILILFFAMLIVELAQGQIQDTEVDEVLLYATPSVEGMGRSKGLVLGYERIPKFDITSESDNEKLGNGSGRVRRISRLLARGFVPVINRPQTKVIFGIDHKIEEFSFEKVQNGTTYSLYENLQNKNLSSLGAQVAYLHSVDAEKFYIVRLKGELNGDYGLDDINVTDYLKTTLDLVYGWKKSPEFAWGVGLQLGYTYGRRSILPAILYNRTYNSRWGVESIFPANVLVRRNVSDKTLLFGGYKLEGASYNLHARSGALAEFGPVEFRRTDIKGMLRLEQEIYDFLWFGVEGGYRRYLRNKVYDEIGSRDELITNDLAGAGYVNVELFFVVPRKFVERNK
jgi:hypothetical protein